MVHCVLITLNWLIFKILLQLLILLLLEEIENVGIVLWQLLLHNHGSFCHSMFLLPQAKQSLDLLFKFPPQKPLVLQSILAI
jgi:hypothetical protein